MDSKPIDPVLAEQRRQNAAAKDAEQARLQARPATRPRLRGKPRARHSPLTRVLAAQADRAARVRERVQKADAEEQRRLAVRPSRAAQRSPREQTACVFRRYC
jgi:hypothetical protein